MIKEFMQFLREFILRIAFAGGLLSFVDYLCVAITGSNLFYDIWFLAFILCTVFFSALEVIHARKGNANLNYKRGSLISCIRRRLDKLIAGRER